MRVRLDKLRETSLAKTLFRPLRAGSELLGSSSRGAKRRGDPGATGRYVPLDCFASLAMTIGVRLKRKLDWAAPSRWREIPSASNAKTHCIEKAL
jgi:hypothetical protein